MTSESNTLYIDSEIGDTGPQPGQSSTKMSRKKVVMLLLGGSVLLSAGMLGTNYYSKPITSNDTMTQITMLNAKYTVFDNNIPGICKGNVATINRKTGEGTGTGTIDWNLEAGKLEGAATYSGSTVEGVTGEYRRASGTFNTVPEISKFAFYKPEHTMYWTEPYPSGDYYYSGILKEDGSFEGFYNAASDAAILNANIDDPASTKSGKVTLTGVTCTLDDG